MLEAAKNLVDQRWSDMRKLFSSKAREKSKEWFAAEVQDVVSILLESVGLGLTTELTRQKQ